MTLQRPWREFLRPEDAMESTERYQVPVSFVNVCYPSHTGSERAHFLPPPSRPPPLPPSRPPLPPSTYPQVPQDFWAVERLQEEFGGQQTRHRRRFSDQDLKTRDARALLSNYSVARKHKPAASYPIYSPNSQYSSSPPSPFLRWGVPSKMESPRLHPRPASPSSSITSRSSFESRMPSPLSRTSSIDWESGVTSEDSSYFDQKVDFLGSKSPIPPPAFPGKQLVTEPIVPRHGVGGTGRKQIKESLTLPPRSVGPPRQNTFGKKYMPRIKGGGFKKLPEEILSVIIAELKKLHLDSGCLSCATCWMRDVMTLGLTCKKWWGAARIALYEDIQLVGKDSIFHTKKRFKIKYGTRLRLLRRTLRTRPDLADHVKVLKVPAMPDVVKSKKEEEEYLDLVASIIMACPNLERLPGFFPDYNHSFSRLVQALSTRTRMTERVWVISPSPFQRQHRYHISDESDMITPILAPGPLLPEQCIDLLTYHSNWTHLHTLVMHCAPGGTVDSLLFADIFHSLPSLENLHVSNFPAPSFNDETLLALPSLKSLRLDHLSGITSSGLSAYASPERTRSLTSLSLINLPVLSIPVIARLFSHINALTHFTISQGLSPSLPIGDEIWLHPYFASRSLQYLHWEFTNTDDGKATDILVKSMQFQGFPALRALRAPSDFDGTLQRLCLPRNKIELSADKYRNMGMMNIPTRPGIPQPGSLPSPTRSTFSSGHASNSSIGSNLIKSPTRSAFSLNLDAPYSSEPMREKGTSLSTARRAAQHRIDNAASHPQFHIIIWDADGQFVERHPISFMGSAESKIFYTLRPDLDGSDEGVGTIDGVGGLLDLVEETACRDPCTGSWNLETGGNGGKKGKERWWHTERGRWREVELGRFI